APCAFGNSGPREGAAVVLLCAENGALFVHFTFPSGSEGVELRMQPELPRLAYTPRGHRGQPRTAAPRLDAAAGQPSGFLGIRQTGGNILGITTGRYRPRPRWRGGSAAVASARRRGYAPDQNRFQWRLVSSL